MKQQQQSHHSHQHRLQQLFWGRVVLRKWLNLPTKKSDYTGDTDSDAGSDISDDDPSEKRKTGSRFKDDGAIPTDATEGPEILLQLRRRKSETFRAQYINKKEIKICTGTWNVAGKMPPDDLDLDGWLNINEPADIYVLGFQEFIKLNAGNIFGAEDNRPVPKWECLIRDTLNKIQPENKFKCYSDPPSPTKFKPSDDGPYFGDDVIFGSDSDCEEEIYPLNEEFTSFDEEMDDQVIKEDEVLNLDDLSNNIFKLKLQKQFPSSKRLDRLLSFKAEDSENTDYPSVLKVPELVKSLSGREKLGICWPEPPMHLLSQNVLERPDSFQPFNPLNSFKNYNSIRYRMNGENRHYSDIALLAEVDLESLIKRKRRSPYVRIVSKQMVGVFLTIWVRRNLRKHMHNVNVSTVGVGAMGYIGNKGSISVSMSVYQTLMCFICSHLASGDKEADLIKRNADVQEIHRRTHFKSISGLPTSIYDHERIIWLGDLNYRINLSYEQTRELISIKDWSQLRERDQLIRELRKGRAFDGWTEGILNFAPTYKYEINEDKYVGDGAKARRTPSWCDRVLSFGNGMKLIKYRRCELQFSDHRPVSASYMVEVEEFSPKKLQRALTFTDAEIEKEPLIVDSVIDSGISQLIYGNVRISKHMLMKQAKTYMQR